MFFTILQNPLFATPATPVHRLKYGAVSPVSEVISENPKIEVDDD